MDTDLGIQQEKGGKKAGTRLEQAAEEYLSQTQADLGDLTETQKKVVLEFVKRRRKADLAVPVTIVLLVAICVVCFCVVCNFVSATRLWGIPDEYIVTTENGKDVMPVSAELADHMKALVYFYAAVTMTLTGALFCGVAGIGSAIAMRTRSKEDGEMLKSFLVE